MTALKTVQFTVRATLAQSVRWHHAADADGRVSVGHWLADAADAYLKARERSGRPVPLAWYRGHFCALLEDGEAKVRGMISTPFAMFCGTALGQKGWGAQRFTLVHLPSKRIIATLPTARQAKVLASELAPVWLRDRELAAGVVDRHQRESS